MFGYLVNSGNLRCNHIFYNFGSNRGQDIAVPKDSATEIFWNLDCESFSNTKQVSTNWKNLTDDVLDKKRNFLFRTIGFGPMSWNRCFGKNFIEGDEFQEAFKSLPLNIKEMPCPIFEGKKLTDTHRVIWIPHDITMNKFINLCLEKFPESIQGSFEVDSNISKLYGDRPVKVSGWIAITKVLLKDTRAKEYLFQKAFVDQIKSQDSSPYMVPNLFTQIVSVFAEFLKYKKANDSYKQYPRRCQETVGKVQCAVLFDEQGFYIHEGKYGGLMNFSVDAMRKI